MTGSFNVTLWSRVQSVNALQIFCVWYWMSLASAVESERGTGKKDGRKALMWCALFGTVTRSM